MYWQMPIAIHVCASVSSNLKNTGRNMGHYYWVICQETEQNKNLDPYWCKLITISESPE